MATYTELERKVIKAFEPAIAEDCFMVSMFEVSLPHTQSRGVFGSLVKKGLLSTAEDAMFYDGCTFYISEFGVDEFHRLFGEARHGLIPAE